MGGHLNDVMAADSSDFLASFDALSVDELANVLEFLPPKDIMRQRRVCRKCSEAATKTIVPLSDFHVDGMESYNTMRVMTRAMPNLQQITISCLEPEFNGFRLFLHKYNDGEDPNEEWAAQKWDNQRTHDIEIISNFSKLRDLTIFRSAPLNGRYPVLFNFPLLQKLKIASGLSGGLKWDLEMLAGLPLLKELECNGNNA
jgi:hypothetical protein